MEEGFAKFHPAVIAVWYAAVIGITAFCINPVLLAVSAVFSVLFAVTVNGTKAIKSAVSVFFPIVLFTAAVNVAFNHAGTRIFLYVNENPWTLESLIYGIVSGVMIFSVIMWFSSFNTIMTSDKLLCISGKAFPSLSLVFSMALRFVPRFRQNLREITDAQKGIGLTAKNSLLGKMKYYFSLFAVMLGISLENSIETADSMRAKGYGIGKRTYYTKYSFKNTDRVLLLLMSAAFVSVAVPAFSGQLHTVYFPYFSNAPVNSAAISAYASFAFAVSVPMFINIYSSVRMNNIYGVRK